MLSNCLPNYNWVVIFYSESYPEAQLFQVALPLLASDVAGIQIALNNIPPLFSHKSSRALSVISNQSLKELMQAPVPFHSGFFLSAYCYKRDLIILQTLPTSTQKLECTNGGHRSKSELSKARADLRFEDADRLVPLLESRAFLSTRPWRSQWQ